MAVAKTPEATKPKRGLLSLLPLIAVILVVPVAGWFGLDYYKKKTRSKAPGSAETAKADEKKEAKHSLHVPSRLPVPIAESPLVFLPGDPKNDVPPRIVTTNAFVANSRKPEEIVITFADPGPRKKHHAVAQFYLVGEDTEALLRSVNEHQAALFESVTNLLSAKYFKDTKVPGFRKVLRSELIGLSNQILGSNLVQEVIIPRFLSQ